MNNRDVLRGAFGLLAAAGLAGAATAVPLATPSVDTVTDLQLGWSWDASGGVGTYAGVHWDAELTATFDGVTWLVEASYRHLDGPHGERAETSSHLHSVSYLPGITGPSNVNSGIDDHGAPDLHLDAHDWTLSANGGPPPTLLPNAATLQVQHVPEPGSWAMMALGLATLMLRRPRRASA
jgi:hypothetical protein